MLSTSPNKRQDEFARSKGLVLVDLIGVNRALGGGWTQPAEDEDPLETAAVVAASRPIEEEEEVAE